MTGSKSGAWIAGTAVVSLLLMVASWLLAISPVMASTAEATTLAQAQRDQNALLQSKLAVLKEQFLKLDEYKATLAGLQAQVPPTSALPDYQRQLAAVAATRGVTIVSVSLTNPSQIVPVVTAPAVDPAAAPADPAAPVDPAAAPAPATTPSAGLIEGFYALGLSMEVVGTYANVTGFLSDLQTSPGRIYAVDALSGISATEGEAAGGRPATAPGDLDLSITGSLFVLTEVDAGAPALVDPAAAPPALPVPPADKNPLLPIGQ